MASGSEDYWMTKSRFVANILDSLLGGLQSGGDILDALDALDGTMDGVLTLSDLNISSVKTNLDTSNTKLQTSIDKLILAITQLTGIHTDTTAMIDFAQEDTAGTAYSGAWYLVASVNAKRNMLVVDINNNCELSRDGSTKDSDVGSGEFTVYDAPGVWLKSIPASSAWTAHEEWAT